MTLIQLRYFLRTAECQSMNEAAKSLFISQPSLSGSIRELESELGFDLFIRTSRGALLTPSGEEFLTYARQVISQYELLEGRFLDRTKMKKKFSVSLQHYTFAVKAFVELVKEYGPDDYEFAIYETRTTDVISDVQQFRSEIGILFQNDFNRQILARQLRDSGLEFTPLLTCHACAYLWKEHPLAERSSVSMKDLEEYPCLAFNQGEQTSLFLSEEILADYDYRQLIKASDRATMLNLMVGLNGFTLCSGLICEELNGSDYVAVPLVEEESMTIGYISRKGMKRSEPAELYLQKLNEYLQKHVAVL